MSTSVDKPKRERLSSSACRDRILHAARIAFTNAGYDAVGVREITARAGVDLSMVSRVFGSKEALFKAVADTAFNLEPAFSGPIEGMGERVAGHLMGPISKQQADVFDEFAFLLRSIGSPTAASILSLALHHDFVVPLAERMGGAQAHERAALITAYVMGFAFLRAGLGSPAIDGGKAADIVPLLGAAIQGCLERK